MVRRVSSLHFAAIVGSLLLLSRAPLAAEETPHPADGDQRAALVAMMRTSRSTWALAGFEMLITWDAFQQANQVTYYTAEGNPAIQRIRISSGTQLWSYVPLDREPGGVLLPISATSGGDQDLAMAFLARRDGRVTASPASIPIAIPTQRLNDGTLALTEPGTAFDGSAGRGQVAPVQATPGNPNPSGLVPPEPPLTLDIAAPGSPAGGHAYFWRDTTLVRASDNRDFGYRIEGVDSIFVHSGYPPDPSGHHQYQATAWAMYTMGGRKMGGYDRFDLARPNNVVTVQGNTRLKLGESTVRITEVNSGGAQVGQHTAFRFQGTEASGGQTVYTFVEIQQASSFRGAGPERVTRLPTPPSGPPSPTATASLEPRRFNFSAAWRSVARLWQDPGDAEQERPPQRRPRSQDLSALLAALWSPLGRAQAVRSLHYEALEPDAPRSERLAIASAFTRVLAREHSLPEPVADEMRETLQILAVQGIRETSVI